MDDSPIGGNRNEDAIRSTFLLTLGEVVVTIIVVGQNRFLAGQIGPAGFGILGLLQSTFRFVSSGASTWLSVPITRWVAEYHAAGDRQRVNSTYSVAMTVSTMIVVTATVIFIIFHNPISDYLFNGEVRQLHFFLFMGITTFASFRTIQTAVLQALLLISRSIQLRVLSASIQLGLVIGLVFWFGLSGLFISMLATLILITLVTVWVLYSSEQIRFVKPRLRSVESRRLLKFGGVNFTLMVFVVILEIMQRGIIVRELGIDSLGLMIAGTQIVAYIDVVNRSAMFYWFPAMSGSLSHNRLKVQYIEFSHFNLYFGIPSVLGGMLFGGLLINLLLGSSFSPLAETIYLFMIWQFINLIHNPSATAIIAANRLKIHAISSLLSGLTVPLFLLLLMDPMGFNAVGVALIAGAVVGYVPRAVSLGLQSGIWGDRRLWALTLTGSLILWVAYLLLNVSLEIRAIVWLLATTGMYLTAPNVDRRKFHDAVRVRGITRLFSRGRAENDA